MFKIKITEFQPKFAFFFIFLFAALYCNWKILMFEVRMFAIDRLQLIKKGAKTYIFDIFQFCVGGWLRGRMTDRQQTAFFRKFRTESRQTKCGQKDIGQSFLQKSGQLPESRQTESGQQTDTGQIRTKTRQRQDTDSTVRQGLADTMVQLFESSNFRKYQLLQIRHNFKIDNWVLNLEH